MGSPLTNTTTVWADASHSVAAVKPTAMTSVAARRERRCEETEKSGIAGSDRRTSVGRGGADRLRERRAAQGAQVQLQHDRMVDTGLDRGVGRGREAVAVIGDVVHGESDAIVD